MIKLYPPYIEGSISAFYGKELAVPYEMNKTVGYKDISGFKLKIITVSTNRTIQIIDDNGYNIETHEVYFNMPIEKMVVGQFYKVQLAYKDTAGEVGFYSTIGVVKYSAEPVVSIAGLEAGNINLHQYDYVGYYEPAQQDSTEAEIYYQFDVYDYNDKLYASSGKKNHNATIEGGDLYRLADSFEKQQVYSIKYTVWTLNGLKVSTRRYRLMERQSLDIEIEAELAVDLNYDEGYINVSLLDTAENEQVVEGAFLITRADSLSDFKQWNELYRFELRNQRLKSFSLRDFTTQQGVEYQYSIQQYNDNGLYSNRLLSKVIKSDFEDCFLYDGDRQLKIRFNPKMASFKNTVLESKVNTIGSKYPFIFRNGNVSYKEFPIGGLISYLSDNENLFLKEYDLDNLHRHNTPANDDNVLDYLPTDLVSDNLTKERLFKLEALEWLTNGEPKLFRSPTEGNYIVRLLNANMTPEQALGRMLHNFTATAYEVAEFNYNNLIFYKFVNPNGIDKAQMKWATVELAIANNGIIEYRTGQLNDYPAITVEFTGMMPGDKVWLDDEEIQIGVNGSYYASLDNPIKSIRVPESAQCVGFMTYGYYGESVSKFNEIFNIELNEVPGWKIEHTTTGWLDILNAIEDARTELVQFYYLRFRKADHLSPKADYKQNNIYPELNNDLIPENNEYLIKINDEIISIKEIETYEIKDLDRPKLLAIGPDIICEAGFQTKTIEYNIEAKNKDLIDLKNEWLTALDNYNKLLQEYPTEMKKLEDVLNYNLLMQKTNKRIEELTLQEKKLLNDEIDKIKNPDSDPYYKLLSFEEAQDYTNYNIETIDSEDKNVFSSARDPWNQIYDQILIEVELATRENDSDLIAYWIARRDELYNIMQQYLPTNEDHIKIHTTENENSKEEKTTSLYHENGSYNYQPKDKFYINNTIVAHPGIEVTISEKGWSEKGESYSLEQAYYLPTEEFNYDPLGDIVPSSLWIDTKDRLTPIIDWNDGIINNLEYFNVGVDTYIGPSDPYTMEVYVDLWIDNSDITTFFEDSLQKNVDMFYYNGESYKDIAYLNIEKYLKAKEKFNKQYAEDEKRIKQDIGVAEFEIETTQNEIYTAEESVYNKKKEIAEFEQKAADLQKAADNAENEYKKAEDSSADKTEKKEAWDEAVRVLDEYLASSEYIDTKTELEEELVEVQNILNEKNKILAIKQSNLTEATEKLEWFKNSKDFLFNMSEEYYTKDGINTPEDYDDGGWRSATIKHCIQNNTNYDNIYKAYEGLPDENNHYPINTINYYRFLAYDSSAIIFDTDSEGNSIKIYPASFLSEKDKQEIENYYYTNQDLTLEESTLVEDIIMKAITDNQYKGQFNYRDKQEFDKNQRKILRLKIEREEALENEPISIIDFSEPERYFLLFSRSHYIENPDTKRPKDAFSKGYCMYQFYDRATAEYRVKQLEISIDDYIKKYDIKETEVEDWLIRNDINERDELLAYLKYLEDFYPQDALSAPGYNIFRPITLNEIKNKKLYVEEELELSYKQFLESKGKDFKRLEIGYSIPDFYYKTKNYTRLKECQDRIIELDKTLADIKDWRDTNPDQIISDLLEQIKNYGNSLENNRQTINILYSKYVNELEKVLEEEEDK